MADPFLHIPRATFQKYGIDLEQLNKIPAEEKVRTIHSKIDELYRKLKDIRNPVEQSTTSHVNNSTQADDENSNNRKSRRTIIVTRRLPVKLSNNQSETGWNIEFQDVDSLNHQMQNTLLVHNNNDTIWMGWTGQPVEPGQHKILRSQLAEKRYMPVYLDERKENLFYTGFCKQVLWPLFHTSPPTTEDTYGHDLEGEAGENSEHKLWQAYVSVNQTFADAILEVYRDGDLIWIQDYHFMLLPQMLRSSLPEAQIGIYFHLPFPSSELFRILPFREEVLHGVINADLVGFQTYDYARHFLSTAEFLLGVECNHNGLEYDGFFTHVCICPIGIDPEQQYSKVKTEEVSSLLQRLEKQYESKTVYLSVDDLDNTQGLVHKLLAFEELFHTESDLANQISFIQVLNCKREGNLEKDELQVQIQRLIARINSRVCRIDFEGPIQLRLNPLVEEITALYGLADIFVNTVIRDGMSVAPMEFILTREALGKTGRVVLSEFAGSSSSLSGSFLVNPWNTTELKNVLGLLCLNNDAEDDDKRSLYEAKGLMGLYSRNFKSIEDPEETHNDMVAYINSNTSQRWGERFIDQLCEANPEDQNSTSRRLHRDHLVHSLHHSKYRLFLFSLEGVLCQRVSMAELIYIKSEVMSCLNTLAEDPNNMVVIKSSRSCDAMEKAMMYSNDGNPTKCVLAAENGLLVKWGSESSWTSATSSFIDNSWKDDILPLMEHYTERTPGSVIDLKENSLTWYYKDCDAGHGSWLAKQLQVGLQEMSRKLPILVSCGDHCLEVTNIAVQTEVPNLVEVCLKQMILALQSRKRRASHVSSNLDELETASESSSTMSKSDSRENLRRELGSEKNSLDLDVLNSEFKTAVDFVFFVGTGMDFRDEEMFEYLAPSAIELDEFVKKLQWVKPDGSADEIQKTPEEGIDKGLGRSRSYGSLPLDTLKRQSDITTQKKFVPRKEFPPPQLIFKAMKQKHGDRYVEERPGSAAACWGLVLQHAGAHPNARAIIDSQSPVEFLKEPNLAKGFAPIFSSTSDLPPLPEGKIMEMSEDTVSEKKTEGMTNKVDPPLGTFSCIIGPSVSQAMYMIKNKFEVEQILHRIIADSYNSEPYTGPDMRDIHSILVSNNKLSSNGGTTDSLEQARLILNK